MLKHDEVTSPNSCLNRAKDDEYVFVLLARDVTAPDTIEYWASKRVQLGRNLPGDPQITEALEAAQRMRATQAQFKPAT